MLGAKVGEHFWNRFTRGLLKQTKNTKNFLQLHTSASKMQVCKKTGPFDIFLKNQFLKKLEATASSSNEVFYVKDAVVALLNQV